MSQKHGKSKEEDDVLSLENEEDLMQKTSLLPLVFFCQMFNPSPDTVAHGGRTRVEAIAPPAAEGRNRDPLFTRESCCGHLQMV